MRLGGLTMQVVLGMTLGAVFGLACHAWIANPETLKSVVGVLDLGNIVFLRAIKMIIAPLVFATLVSGVAQMGGSGAVGRVAGRALAFFVVASIISLTIGLLVVSVVRPGEGLNLASDVVATGLKPPPLTAARFLEHLIPTSIVDAMAHNEVLQIVVFSVLTGVTFAAIGEPGRQLVHLTEALAVAMLKMTTYVMALAPIAVFASVGKAMAEQGIGIIASYAAYVGGFYVALGLLWAIMILGGGLALGTARKWALLKAIRQPVLIALTTTSSEAAYPALLEKLEAFGVPNRIASFVLPLGYAFNLVGSMCYCVFAALFAAQAFNVPLDGGQILQLMLLLFVMSKGIASVPRASLLVVAATLPYFNIPDAAVVLLLAVDHFLDMGRTATNTAGNAIVAAVISAWEGNSQPDGAVADQTAGH